MNQSAYFDLEDILVNELFGDIWLFLIVGIILVWVICLKAKTQIHTPMVFSIVWIAICFSTSTQTLLITWIMAILAAGFMMYYNFSKVLRF